MNAVSNHVSPMIRRVTKLLLPGAEKEGYFYREPVLPKPPIQHSRKKLPTLHSKDENYVLAIILVSFKLTDTVHNNCGQLFRAED